MKHAIEALKGEGFIKKIFLLTDGEVYNSREVAELARSKNEVARVHTLGVGYGCSRELVRSVALAGRGSCSIVEDSQNL